MANGVKSDEKKNKKSSEVCIMFTPKYILKAVVNYDNTIAFKKNIINNNISLKNQNFLARTKTKIDVIQQPRTSHTIFNRKCNKKNIVFIEEFFFFFLLTIRSSKVC